MEVNSFLGRRYCSLISVIFVLQRSSSVNYDKVVEVVDGDTFFIQNRQPIRLYGINAPELGNCYGEESKAELTKILLGKEVRLTGLQSDHYGRVVAGVYYSMLNKKHSTRD